MLTKVFRSGNSKAIRIPASIHLDVSVVEIMDLGAKGILITPIVKSKDPWELFKEGLNELDGKWPDRDQGNHEKRDGW